MWILKMKNIAKIQISQIYVTFEKIYVIFSSLQFVFTFNPNLTEA